MNVGIMGSGMIVGVVTELWRREFPQIVPTAMWGRLEDAESLERRAATLGVPTTYTDLDAFLEDDSFDVAYVGLVNSLHYEFTRRALEAGKSVVCEKPFVSTASQARELVELAEERGLFVLESVVPWYQRNYGAIRERLGELGEVKLVQVSLSQRSRRYDAYLKGDVLPVFDPALDGGALMDMGVYSAHWVMGLLGAPERVAYYPNKGPNGIDTSGALVMDYGTSTAVCLTAKDSASPNCCVIQGTRGSLVVNGGPAQNDDVLLTLNGQGSERVGERGLDDGFACVWRRVLDVYKRHDLAWARAFMERVTEVMDVMERARLDAGIVFPCDGS